MSSLLITTTAFWKSVRALDTAAIALIISCGTLSWRLIETFFKRTDRISDRQVQDIKEVWIDASLVPVCITPLRKFVTALTKKFREVCGDLALEQNQDKIDEITTNFDSFFKEKRDRIESKLRIIAPISGNHYNQIQDIINDFEDAHWEHFSMVTNNEKGTGLQSAAFGYETTLYTGLNKTLRTLYLLNNSDDLSNFFGFEITFKEKIFRNGKRAFKGVINGTHNLAQKKNAICYTPFTNNNAIPQLDEPAYMYKLKFLRALRERACCDITFPTEELKRVHKEDGKIWACKMFILMTICHVILWLSSPIWFPLCATRKWWKLTNELPNMETDMEWKAAMIIQRPELFSRIY